MHSEADIAIVGAGAAGLMAAIHAGRQPGARRIVVLDGAETLGAKILVAGGGRCNVTHACFEPRVLVTRYPRGGRELRGPLHAFGPSDTVAWFAARGVELKTEADGRMFPTTDSSQTIIDALQNAARTAGVEVRTRNAVTALMPEGRGWRVDLADGTHLAADAVLLASGGRVAGQGADGHSLAAGCGHAIVPAVPSLFTLNIADPLLTDLPGVAVPAGRIRVAGVKGLDETGPILVTHWGLSGPAVLRLSAWGARHLHEHDYRVQVLVNWTGKLSVEQIDAELQETARSQGRQAVRGTPLFGLPRRLWRALVVAAGLYEERRWGELGKTERRDLAHRIGECAFEVEGQTTFKEEFATCGGVALKEIDFKTMASRVAPGLFLAGEVLDIDGVTGGFNFQACWTTGWLAGGGLAGYGANA